VEDAAAEEEAVVGAVAEAAVFRVAAEADAVAGPPVGADVVEACRAVAVAAVLVVAFHAAAGEVVVFPAADDPHAAVSQAQACHVADPHAVGCLEVVFHVVAPPDVRAVEAQWLSHVAVVVLGFPSVVADRLPPHAAALAQDVE
jgi:hypothetical protein